MVTDNISTLPAPPPVKVCACGCTYDLDEWDALPTIGQMDELVLKNCPAPCFSTLALEVS